MGDANCIAEPISANAGFDLYLDGVLQPSTVDVDVIDGVLGKLYVTNYPSGLPAGTYMFVGVHTLDDIAVLTRTTITVPPILPFQNPYADRRLEEQRPRE